MTREDILYILRTAFPDISITDAVILRLLEYVDSVRTNAYNEGYDEGNDRGREDGFIGGKEEGYEEGYRKGYEEGAYNAGELIKERALWLNWEDRRRISEIARGKL